VSIAEDLIDIGCFIWGALFLSYWVLVLIVYAIQAVRRKPFWDTPLSGPITILHYALILPIMAASLIVVALYQSVRWVARKLRP
jgi:hypothetical protein